MSLSEKECILFDTSIATKEDVVTLNLNVSGWEKEFFRAFFANDINNRDHCENHWHVSMVIIGNVPDVFFKGWEIITTPKCLALLKDRVTFTENSHKNVVFQGIKALDSFGITEFMDHKIFLSMDVENPNFFQFMGKVVIHLPDLECLKDPHVKKILRKINDDCANILYFSLELQEKILTRQELWYFRKKCLVSYKMMIQQYATHPDKNEFIKNILDQQVLRNIILDSIREYSPS